ncbi:TFIIH basal transcription factor complex TTD-A subunit [Nematocida homosporus]|uniref:TFIIH basal transcription factor complex TTD-A subunit n=1 Tax=Nematocida homosporus TaxID=1912981 RepID=UPI00222039E3|nr:TFIIH basal transcription factor complex TTD-A subunit [Nematocida homosporus]KAI5184888.1 TFIIH basal transcription factor complex TTD-A subunit [Nematocida homosporus]
MVKAIKGTLLKCDASIKQIVVRLNREHNFIIHDIDDNTLFIDRKYLSKIEEETERMINHIVKKSFD